MRLINADALREYIKECDYCRNCDERDRFCQMDCELPELTEKVERMIAEQPTVDPVKHGHWIDPRTDVDGMYEFCSVCGEDADITHYGKHFAYCPNCGAKMDEEADG